MMILPRPGGQIAPGSGVETADLTVRGDNL
jgi:hypothetical protein